MQIPSLTDVVMNFFGNGCDRATALREGEKFYIYHHTRGWRMGKYPMKSWAGAAATWRRNMSIESNNISAPRPIAALQNIKTETDEAFYRVVEQNRVFEFGLNKPPPKDTAHYLAWLNWKANPEAYRKTA